MDVYGKSQTENESLINTLRIYRTVILTEFGMEKFTILRVRRGKLMHIDGIKEADNEIKSLESEAAVLQ